MAGLFTPSTGVALLTHHATSKTVTLPNGKRAKVTIDDSGTVTQVECGDRLDAIVRPRTVRIQIKRGDPNGDR